MPNSTGVWGDQMLQIPANTPLTISNCQILEVDYYLLVSLKIPNGVNLKVIIPLQGAVLSLLYFRAHLHECWSGEEGLCSRRNDSDHRRVRELLFPDNHSHGNTRTDADLEGRHLMPNSTGVWGDQMLRIPANTPLTISNCQILEVDYYLQVSLKIPNGVNLKVIIPLVICSIPVYRPPADF
ncbi:hypothetical protein COCON_G00154480 [Conger conger]|uniref:Arrestin C-terminal-like domain-containing protein n=1 Tax=Conger conger TaxID=82655 RepID=A0A9Q1HUU3_CONCO|nr:hypothetical protein COCON_G00154480 [Conger conger]